MPPLVRVTGVEGIIADVDRQEIPVVGAVGSFDGFFAREYRSVVGLAFVLSGSKLAAEDLAQEAFVAAYRSWSRIGEYDKREAWVRRVVANRSMSWLRRRTAEARALVRVGGGTATVPDMSPPTDELWQAVRRLPKRQAQALAFHYLEDMPIEEIGEVLGISPGTVKAHLHRGRRSLAERLGLSAEEPE